MVRSETTTRRWGAVIASVIVLPAVAVATPVAAAPSPASAAVPPASSVWAGPRSF